MLSLKSVLGRTVEILLDEDHPWSPYFVQSKAAQFCSRQNCEVPKNIQKRLPLRWRERVVMLGIHDDAHQRHVLVPVMSSAASMRRTYLYFMNTKHHNAPSKGGGPTE